MDAAGDSQGDEASYEEQAYFEQMDSGMQDGEYGQRSPLREQDRFLPIANVAKIMKRSVPTNGKIAKEAKECVQECVSEFISFITSEAAERCQNEKRKTVNGEDLLFAINNLGFDNYVEALKKFLLKYREASKLDSALIDEATIANINNQMPTGPATVILNLPQSIQVASGAAQTNAMTARPITVVSSSVEGEHTVSTDTVATQNATITLGGQPYAQQIILTSAAGPLTSVSGAMDASGKGDEDVKFNSNTTILVPISGQVTFVNGQPTITTTPVSTSDQPVVVTSSM